MAGKQRPKSKTQKKHMTPQTKNENKNKKKKKKKSTEAADENLSKKKLCAMIP